MASDILHDIENYIHAVASNEPTPGGGSVAAVVGGLGAALGSMVVNFTLGKKKYAEYQTEAQKTLENLNDHIRKLLDLSQKDVNTYAIVAKAYAMPKETDTEKKQRNLAIENASEIALKVPFEMLKVLQRISDCLGPLSEYGNRNLDSDMAGAAILTNAAAETAYFCVYANIPFLKDEQKIDKIKQQLKEMRTNIQKDCQQIISSVGIRMNIELMQ